LSLSGSGANLSWASTSDTTWDTLSTNWFNLDSSTQSVFYAGDSVLLDDSNGVVTTISIPSGVTVYPASITDTATNNNFTISGAGHIGGSGGIVKSGLATLAINTANTFSGVVDVQAGTLQAGNATALGTTANGTTVEPGATLDVNGQNLGGEAITISSNGVSEGGALVNNGGGQAQALRTIILAGDATIGGSGLLGINNSGGAASLSTGGNPYSLTKVGANQLTLQNCGIDAALANIDIQQGIIEFANSTATLGDPSYTNTVESGAEISFSQNTVTWIKQFIFNGNGSSTTVNLGTGATTTLGGPVELHGGCVFNVGGTLLTITNTISGDGGLIKNGGSPMIITGPTLYTGDTTINGTSSIRLVAPADLSWSTNIVINSGAFLTVTGMVGSTFPLSSGHTLGGHGVINGALTANAGSIVSPSYTPSTGATAPVGLLTVSNAIILSGTTIMELDPDNGTNDMLKSGISTITYGGTLNLTNITASPLTNGASYKLFSASSYLNSFTSIIPPTPGPSQTWDTSALGTTGTIKVLSTAPLAFGSITTEGNTVVITGANGTPSTQYYVLASTNLATPLASWSRIATNSFDGAGHFAFTNSLIPPLPQRFYQIQMP
jgi:autotransporter-associated beta strand protein